MKPKYIKLCVDMMAAIAAETISIDYGAYYIMDDKKTEIQYCPWCGVELVDWELLTASEQKENEG